MRPMLLLLSPIVRCFPLKLPRGGRRAGACSCLPHGVRSGPARPLRQPIVRTFECARHSDVLLPAAAGHV